MMSSALAPPARAAPAAGRRGRSHLVALEGGRGRTGFVSSPPCRPVRLPAAIVRRRRLTILGVVAAALFVAAGWFDGVGSRPDRSAAMPSERLAAPGDVYVVRPGDTLWSIARRLEPSGDVRATVDRMVEAHGSATVDVGDRIPLEAVAGARGP